MASARDPAAAGPDEGPEAEPVARSTAAELRPETSEGEGDEAGDFEGLDALEAALEAASEAVAPPPEPEPPPPPPKPETPEEEVARILGPNLKSPVGIPKAYQPSDLSTHELLRVELEDFAGPLDLLLFLIRKHDLDVFDIPIAFITEQYLRMLDSMQALPLDVAAEFLVMAAELTHIKSKMLLPPKEGVPVEAEETEEGDPRADLVRRLLEYQKYRDAADELGDFDRLGRDVFARVPAELDVDDGFDPGFREVSIFKLVDTMAEVLSRLEPKVHHEITRDTISVPDRVRYILDFGARHGARFGFLQLLDGARTRQEVVMTFLALLEMARTRLVRIEQEPEPVGPPPPPLPPELSLRARRDLPDLTAEDLEALGLSEEPEVQALDAAVAAVERVEARTESGPEGVDASTGAEVPAGGADAPTIDAAPDPSEPETDAAGEAEASAEAAEPAIGPTPPGVDEAGEAAVGGGRASEDGASDGVGPEDGASDGVGPQDGASDGVGSEAGGAVDPASEDVGSEDGGSEDGGSEDEDQRPPPEPLAPPAPGDIVLVLTGRAPPADLLPPVREEAVVEDDDEEDVG